MDNRLTQAGIIAIPIKENKGNKLYPQPNWLVIDNLFGVTKAEIPSMGEVICQNSFYKIAHREILPEEFGRTEQMTERIFEQENQPVPVGLLPSLFSHERINQNIDAINQMLSLFTFRGILSGFVLEIDSEVLSEILENK